MPTEPTQGLPASHLGEVIGNVGRSYLACRLPPITVIAGIAIATAAWLGADDNIVIPLVGFIAATSLATHWFDDTGKESVVGVLASVVLLFLCGMRSSGVGAGLYGLVSIVTPPAFLTVIFFLFRLQKKHRLTAASLNRIISELSDQQILEGLDPPVASVARSWLSGNEPVTAVMEEAIHLGALRLALKIHMRHC